jgi:hypothetical protein
MPLQVPYAYIVCLELKTTSANYKPLFDALQASFKWWHYLAPVWIVLRYETLVELQTLLLPLIFKDDRLLILPAKGPPGGWLPMEAWDWINQNVPREW